VFDYTPFACLSEYLEQGLIKGIPHLQTAQGDSPLSERLWRPGPLNIKIVEGD
jgi:hypothetical protein